jgi:peptidoglycan hydrolase-like protein with peptidoglycan-binding domain
MVRFKFAEKTMWAGVTELWEDGVVLKTPGESYKLSRGDFRDCYDGVAVVFWRDPAHDDPILKLGATGNLVTNLQKRLQKLDRFPGKITGHYEQDTANAIARIQAETGLKVDALAGTQVRMIFSAWLPKKGTPLLNPKLAHTPPEDELPVTPLQDPAPAPVPATEPTPVVAPPPTPEPAAPPEPVAQPAAPEQQQEQPAPTEKIAPTPEQAPATNPAAYSDALDKSMPVPAAEKAPVMWGLEAPSVKSEDIPAADVSSLPPASIDSSKEVTPSSVGSVPFLPRGGDAVETNGKQP